MAADLLPGLPSCRMCGLCDDKFGQPQRPVPGEGPTNARVMLVGEAPGETEARSLRPFIGRAGTLLRDTLTAVGINPADLYITNAVKHLPPAIRKPKAPEIKTCRQWVDMEIAALRPELIVCLGDTAMKAVLGWGKKSRYPDLTLTAARRRDDLVYQLPTCDDSDLGGQVTMYYTEVPVMVAFHPSAALRMAKNMAPFMRDMTRLAEKMGVVGRGGEGSEKDYTEIVPERGYTFTTGRVMALDTEYDDAGNLYCFSFSFEEHTARVMLLDQQREWALAQLWKLISTAGRIVMHNAKADIPVICRALGWPLERWPWYKTDDSIIGGYVLGKKPLALKSLAEDILGEKVIRLEELRAEGEPLSSIPRDQLVRYSAQDSALTLALWNRFAPALGVVR